MGMARGRRSNEAGGGGWVTGGCEYCRLDG